MVSAPREAFILGASADIGIGLIQSFRADGYRVGGTYRSEKGFADHLTDDFIHCDFRDARSIDAMVARYVERDMHWNVLISAVGTMEPVGRFFDVPFSEWENSLRINLMSQLEAVHRLYPYRRPGVDNHLVFFAGGGTNNPMRNYSAYCVSKIALIKMCELLDDECPDLNVFIVGPGWVRTKIHEETLRNADRAGDSYAKTLDFLSSGKAGTDMQDIYDCIAWGIREGRSVVGGRNFSVVHDKWGEEDLRDRLAADQNLYKLRRYSRDL